jgi:hypothetical protein
MNQRGAFKATVQMAQERGMSDNSQFPSLSLSHIKSMEERIEPGFSEAKVGRWLGWAQCAVVAAGLATLDEMKTINLRYSVEEIDDQECLCCGLTWGMHHEGCDLG